jgi:hypothetical protein
MKLIKPVLTVLIIVLSLVPYSRMANAAQPNEMFIMVDKDNMITISLDEPCTKFKVPNGHKVFKASVTNSAVHKEAYGCWELEDSPMGAMVHIDIVLPSENSFFSYRYPAEQFAVKANL